MTMKTLAKIIAIATAFFTLATSSAGAQEKIGESLEFDKTVHNFGDILLDSGPVSCTFKVKNTGSKPVVIYNAVTTCGCTKAEWTKEPIMPGKTGTISATYSNDEGPYPFDKSITVYMSEPKKPIILKMRGICMEEKVPVEKTYTMTYGPLGLREAYIKCGNLEQGGMKGNSVTVANISKAPIKVEFKDVSEQLEISISPNPVPAGETAEMSFCVKSDRSKWGRNYHWAPPVINGKTYRNYSFGWDDSNKVAYWVAYPLCGLYTYQYAGKNVRHEEYFIKDPLLGNASPRPGTGYAGDYDRGHQVPSADRQCSELANGQTYYGTNMTAQSNPLNGGPWANLENAVRNFANSTDTTYVVSGCYVKNSNVWETDSDGMRIKVPTAYFKAVLVLKNGNWTGGAYWTPHVGYSSSYSSWAISIDDLEQKTGLDLYVNLPKMVGASAAASVEAARPGDAKWWN
jgi:DNA/RNA endonuclease G (NUC1)